jgi:hypothetical protein
MPEKQNTMRTTQEPRAIDHIGASIYERGKHLDEVLRVVFQISVLDEDIWSARSCETGPEGGALSRVLGMIENFHPGVLILLKKLPGSIGGRVVDHNYFDVQTALEHAINDFLYGGVLVVHGDDDGDRDLRKITAYPLWWLSYARKWPC